MGQKVHPGGLRVGVIHDWKSNWWTGKKEIADYILEDIRIREHINGKLSHAGLSDILIRKDKQRITVDIYTARPGIVIGKSGRRGGRAPQGAPRDHGQVRPHQHQRDQAARARRAARRAVDRGAAPEPRLVPARDEALARLGDAVGRAGDQDPVRRPARRRRDEPQRALHRGPRAAAHDPRRHRLRLRRGEDDLRPDRRQGLGQQGRDHAGGLRGLARPRAHLRGRRLAPPARLEHGGPRRLPRERPRSRAGPRGPRPRAEAPPPGGRGRGAQGRGRPPRDRGRRGARRDAGASRRPGARDAASTDAAPESTPQTPPETTGDDA